MVKRINIKMPEDVKFIMNLLESSGYKAYVVGGCVRDALLGEEPNDWDITTNATPYQVIELCIQKEIMTLPIGIEYGTVVILLNNERYEVTTFRSDGEYIDGRRPSSVKFESTLLQDIMRRDLTINALAYNETEGIIDYVGGYDDLRLGEIRFVGNAVDRLNEDTLRALRAFRFWCKFNYNMDKEVQQLCFSHFVSNHTKITTERAVMEIIKLFSCKNISVEKLDVIMKLLASTYIPEIQPMINCTQYNAHHKYTVYMHTIHVMNKCSSFGDARLMFAALLHDIGKPSVKTVGKDGYEHFVGHPDASYEIGKSVLQRLKMSNSFMYDVLNLVKYHDNFNMNVRMTSLRRFMAGKSSTYLKRWKALRLADIQSQVYTKEKEENYKKVIQLMDLVEKEGSAFTLASLQINGQDIINMGIIDRTKIKDILQSCLDNCYGNPACNNREWLLKWANKQVKKCNGQGR